jgi:hypothetical protein
MKKLILVLAVSVFSTASRAEESSGPTDGELVTLNPIIAEGTAAESLKFDPIVPAYTGRTKGRVSTGDVSKEIANDLPFHSNTNLIPGNETSFTGVGKNAEETDVNFLGIPINRPQGGGADLGSFPQYFWSGYSYQIGPSLGAFDPRGVGGSLTLRLWTQDAIGTESQRATAFASTRGQNIQQFSYGRSNDGKIGPKYAALAGLTTGTAFGPALSFSAIPYEVGDWKVTTHLVYSDVNAKNFVSERSGTTSAEQHTYRGIPVVQVDKKFSDATRLKTNFFYDLSYIRYEDRANAASKQIKKIHQAGNESAFISRDTRIGFGVRHVSYDRSEQTAIGDYPSEQVLNTQITQGLRFGSVLLEPTLGGYAVTRKGFYPTGSVGLRNENRFGEAKFGQFIRAGFTKRFPSLLDRYYEINVSQPGFTLRGLSNPGLQPENVRSVETGVDYTNDVYRNQITFFARDYKHARYTRFTTISPFPTILGFQIVNAGNAYVFGFTQSQDWKALPFLDLGTRVTLQRSKIDDVGSRFPYTPEWVGILRADIHHPDQRYGLEIVNKAATNFITYNDSNRPSTLPGYGYLDLYGHVEAFAGVNLVLGVENVFDRNIQFRQGILDEGRVYSLTANAVF